MPGDEMRDSDDNWDVTVLKPEHFWTVAAANLMSMDAFEDMVQSSKDYDPEVTAALQRLRYQGPNQLPNVTLEWEEIDGMIYYHGCLYIPRGEDLH
jgi:hypothetical protein